MGTVFRGDNEQNLPKNPRNAVCGSKAVVPYNPVILVVRVFADCGNSLPPQEAATGNPESPWRYRVLPKLKKAVEGFSHGQLVAKEKLTAR